MQKKDMYHIISENYLSNYDYILKAFSKTGYFYYDTQQDHTNILKHGYAIIWWADKSQENSQYMHSRRKIALNAATLMTGIRKADQVEHVLVFLEPI